MAEAWIQLLCPASNHQWEWDPTDLPDTDAEFTCDHCGEERRMAEFTKTHRDLELLKQFA